MSEDAIKTDAPSAQPGDKRKGLAADIDRLLAAERPPKPDYAGLFPDTALAHELAKTVLYKGDFAAFMRDSARVVDLGDWEQWRNALLGMAGKAVANAKMKGNLPLSNLYYGILMRVLRADFPAADHPLSAVIALADDICQEIAEARTPASDA